MATVTQRYWFGIPDIIGDGVSEQEEIMTAICEAKGATFNGVDCVGELNNSTLLVRLLCTVALPGFAARCLARSRHRLLHLMLGEPVQFLCNAPNLALVRFNAHTFGDKTLGNTRTSFALMLRF